MRETRGEKGREALVCERCRERSCVRMLACVRVCAHVIHVCLFLRLVLCARMNTCIAKSTS